MVHEVDPRELFSRYEGNPIIKAAAFPRMVNAVFNPAAVMFEGQTLLLMRVEDRSGLSRLVVATSDNGFTDWEVDDDRAIVPDLDCFEEQWGVEDPRITRDDDGGYLIVYTGYSPGGPLVCLATTTDFRTFKKRGVIQSPEDKDAALLPRKFGGRWGLIHRPASRGAGHGAHIWLSWSPDLRHWGDSQILLPARRGAWWDAEKIGLGPPPLLTNQGWLVCYHGVRVTVSGSIYRLGLALLDRDDPTVVIARGNEWVFGPHTIYGDRATSPTSCSRAAGSSTRTATRCGCTTVPRTASSASRPPASTTSSTTCRTTLRSRGRRCHGSTSRPSECSPASATMAAGGNSVPRAGVRAMERIGHYIGGKVVLGESGRSGPVFDPATGVQTHEVDLASTEEVDRAVQAAAEAFPAWRATSLAKRSEIMFGLRELVDLHRADIAKLLTAQHGKVLSDAMGEVARGLENIEFSCGVPNLLKGGFSEQVSTGVDVYSIRQPLGVVAGSRRSTSRPWCPCGCSRTRSRAGTRSC